MFIKLKQLFESEDTLQQPYDDLSAMLHNNLELYKLVREVLLGNVEAGSVKDEIYQRDVSINKDERHIRREIVTHVSVNPEHDAVGCLVLMSLVKDAERMGDHSKNLFEAIEKAQKKGPELQYWPRIAEFEAYVLDVYSQTIDAFSKEDMEAAENIVRNEVDKNREFDAFLNELAASDVSAREAVATTLIARALKRIQGHLCNIASSVIQPVHQLDHRPKDLRPGSDD